MLAILAHPDDETFGLGGTLALYAKRGVAVHLICATRGEAGTVSPEFLERYSSIADLRVAELNCAAEQLRLEKVHFLDYRDSGMVGTEDNEHPNALTQAPLEEVVATLVGYIRRLRPQVVITFDPVGGYGHPDHIAVHKATVKAYEAAADPELFPDAGSPFQSQKLYFSTFSFRFIKPTLALLRLFGRDPRRWGRNEDMDLTEIFQTRFPVNAKVNYRKVADQKRRALACHASQLDMGPSSRGLLGALFWLNRAGTVETFMRADPQVSDGRVERDLFQGIRLQAVA
ncbi:MAG: PIG-L family deacetylase [Chloroflexi bacterium]|nr:PIG-L family deacetylase [Chloroflexota bacterium]